MFAPFCGGAQGLSFLGEAPLHSLCPKGKSGELIKSAVYFERSEWHVLAMEWGLMIRRLQIDFRKNSVFRCLIKQILLIWGGKRIHVRITIYCRRIDGHHPWLETVPKDKDLCPPRRR